MEAGRRPVGGRGQEVSADWKCPTDGSQVTTMRRVLERGANESLRWVTGRRGWERYESGRSNRVKTEPETRSPARGEFGASSDASSSLNGVKVKVVGLRRPLRAAGFRGQILGRPTKGLRESGGLLFFGRSLCAWPGAAAQSSWLESTRFTATAGVSRQRSRSTDATCRPSTNSASCIRCWRRSMHDRDCGLCRCVFAAANAMDVCR